MAVNSTSTNQTGDPIDDPDHDYTPDLSDSAWATPAHSIRPLSKRYQATFRYVTNKAITWISVFLIASVLLNLVLVAVTVSVDIEDLYAMDGTMYSCKLSK